MREGCGLENDGYAGDWHSQVSLPAKESINMIRVTGLALAEGIFAEVLQGGEILEWDAD